MKSILFFMLLILVVNVLVIGCAKNLEQLPVRPFPEIPTLPESPDVDTEVKELKKGWFPEYDVFIKEELVKSKYLLKFNSSTRYWTDFLKAIAKAESNHDPTAQYWERYLNNGVDPETGRKYMSEGLLQLSYSDAKWYKCNFDLKLDINKSERDHTKTIFTPKNNLQCGVKILDSAVRRKGKPIFSKNQYWAVLMPRKKKDHARFKTAFRKYQNE